jgi:hypothetical protein
MIRIVKIMKAVCQQFNEGEWRGGVTLISDRFQRKL